MGLVNPSSCIFSFIYCFFFSGYRFIIFSRSISIRIIIFYCVFQGYLTVNTDSHDVSIKWDSDLITLKSHMSYGGRGMELSELIVFNGKLYAVDDRTGIIFEIDLQNNIAIPWVVLMDGNGKVSKGIF